MSSVIGTNLLGRPIILEKQGNNSSVAPVVTAPSQFIKKLQVKDPYSLWGRIQRICLWIFNCFYKSTAPSKIAFKALIESSQNPKKKDILQLFSNCLYQDGKSTSLLDGCENLLQEVRGLKLFVNPDKALKALITFKNNFQQRILGLKNGQSLLLPLTTRDDVAAFYLIQRTPKGFSLKIVGCDQWMPQITGVPSKKIGGKEKVLSQAAFQDIPESYFNQERIQSLFCTPLLENAFNAAEIGAKLAEIPTECRHNLTDRKELWVTQSGKARKALGLVMQETGIVKETDSQSTKGARKRLEFQTRLAPFFDLYNQSRFILEADASYCVTLKNLTQEIARDATILGHKGYLSKTDLEEIQKKLALITQTIKKAEKNSVVSLSSLGSISPLTLKMPMTGSIQTPQKMEEKSQNFAVRPPQNLIHPLPITKTSLISAAEQDIMRSLDKVKVLELLKAKSNWAKDLAFKGEKELAVTLIIELTSHLDLEQLKFNNEKNCWHGLLSPEQVLELHTYLIDLTRVLVENRNNDIPLPNQAIALFLLVRFSGWLDRITLDNQGHHRVDNLPPIWDIEKAISGVLNHNIYSGDVSIYHEHQRPFYLSDEENTPLISTIKKNWWDIGFRLKASREQCKKSEEYSKLQRKLFYDFFGLESLTYDSKLLQRTFHPQLIQRWSKTIKHPLLMAALRQMSVHGDTADIVRKLEHEGKLGKGQMTSFGDKPTITGWKSEEERAELQKDLDRLESLKLPEAINDDPKRVFEKQLEALLERMKEYEAKGAMGSYSPQSDYAQFKKEELIDLLVLLRSHSPQLEVFGFIKSHPHLISNPDIRNYLEIVLFDVGGSIMAETFELNPEFVKSLPAILKAEIDQYLPLAIKDSQFNNHLLFIFSLARKFKGLYTVLKQDPQATQEFDQILNLPYLDQVLSNRSLREYHYRAAFESLMLKISNPTDLIEIIKRYHQLKTLPRESHDFDPNEIDRLNRRYAVFLQSLKDTDIQTLSPLLDTLCTQEGWKLDSSVWKGSFPRFKNDQYEIDLLKGEVIDCTSGAFSGIIPAEISQQPVYAAAFKDVDAATKRVSVIKKGEATIYHISDKEGKQGSIEIEKGSTRIYKHFENQKTLQVLAIPADANHHALHCLVGDALFVSPQKPEEGICFDTNGKIQYKVQLSRKDKEMQVKSIIDCRGGKESGPFDIQTADKVAHSGLKQIKAFENGKNILLFLKNGKLEKINLVRYGLSFTYKDHQLFSDDPQLTGYAIDLNGSLDKLSDALVLRHQDESMPEKVILKDMSKHVAVDTLSTFDFNKLSYLRRCWLLIKIWWTGKMPDPAQLAQPEPVEETSDNPARVLKSHVFNIRPYTGEMVVAQDKKRVESSLALIHQAFSNHHPDLALKAFKQMKLVLSDLTQSHVSKLLNYEKFDLNDDGEAASLKIQMALQLKQLMGERVQFVGITETLSKLIEKHSHTYLRQGRKIHQQLLLSQTKFDLMAKIVEKENPSFYEQHVRLFFLKEGDQLPPFSKEGMVEWGSLPKIDFDQRIHAAKEAGLHGVDQIPLEHLEAIRKTAYQSNKTPVALEKEGTPLVFQEKELEAFFEATPYILPAVTLPEVNSAAPSCEHKAVEKLKREMQKFAEQAQGKKQYALKPKQTAALQKKLTDLKNTTKTTATTHKQKIETLLQGNGDAVLELAIKGGLQKVASFQDISIAYMQRDLRSLKDKGLFPANINLGELETTLRGYFEAESRHQLLQNAAKLMDQPNQLYQLLTAKRFYSLEKNPELLVYECFTQQVFRQLGFEKNQIHLLTEILANPNGVFQAITGAGKTTVMSVLRGLLQANGTNLVTFRLLPTLFEQSKSILQQKLGDTFNKKIYPLRFNLKMSPVIRERRENKIVEESLFKKIYQDLLMTVKEKGCVLTCYKSIPLMQEKWIKLNREFIARRKDGSAIPPIELEHREYLRKILLLVGEREETLMDEFDLPNRSCNRLQIPLGKPTPLAPFLYEKSLELYRELKQDPRLKLAQDQQRDLQESVREAVIYDLAKKVAAGNQDLLDYFLGKKQIDLSTYPKDQRDTLTLYKEQLSRFLPLSLRKASGLDYQRSTDGKRTVPCHDGEPQENSRFGHPLEEINQTAQDYIQNGVSLLELKQWIKDLQDASVNSEVPLRQFLDIFPNHPFPKGRVSEEKLLELQKELNGNWNHVEHFLKLKFQELSVSGAVISMTPHDSAAMPKAVAGLSATMGCPEELPRELQIDTRSANGILGEMAYRLIRRTGTNQKPLEYNPEKPFDVLNQGSFEALIDGAGAFRAYPGKHVADQFKQAQPKLKQVGFHEGHQLDFVGNMECLTPEKGFYFNKAKSRGADIPLDAIATGLVTVDPQKALEDLLQNEGRMRLPLQRIRLARSTLNPEIDNTEALLISSARHQGQKDAVGLFRSKMQQIPHLVRQQAYNQHLAIENLDDSLSQFERWEALFIQKPAFDYSQSGAFFEQNHRIHKIDHKPQTVLEKKKQESLKQAQDLGLNVPDLQALQWEKEVIEKMPPFVSGPEDNVALDLEVEQEVEIEHEVEVEMEVEIENELEQELHLDQCGDVPFYPAWIKVKPREYSAAQWLHPAFDPRIKFTENFLPVERKDSLFKRTPFDQAMPKIRNLHLFTDYFSNRSYPRVTTQVMIGDVLDDVIHRPYGVNYKADVRTKSSECATYDIRTRKIVASGGLFRKPSQNDIDIITAQARFINGDFEGYSIDEWHALCKWLKESGKAEELQQFFEKTILRTSPQKAAAFRKSPLHDVFETLKKRTN